MSHFSETDRPHYGRGNVDTGTTHYTDAAKITEDVTHTGSRTVHHHLHHVPVVHRHTNHHTTVGDNIHHKIFHHTHEYGADENVRPFPFFLLFFSTSFISSCVGRSSKTATSSMAEKCTSTAALPPPTADSTADSTVVLMTSRTMAAMMVSNTFCSPSGRILTLFLPLFLDLSLLDYMVTTAEPTAPLFQQQRAAAPLRQGPAPLFGQGPAPLQGQQQFRRRYM